MTIKAAIPFIHLLHAVKPIAWKVQNGEPVDANYARILKSVDGNPSIEFVEILPQELGGEVDTTHALRIEELHGLCQLLVTRLRMFTAEGHVEWGPAEHTAMIHFQVTDSKDFFIRVCEGGESVWEVRPDAEGHFSMHTGRKIQQLIDKAVRR